MQIFNLFLSILLEGLKCIVFEERCGQNKTDNFGAAVLILFLWVVLFVCFFFFVFLFGS